MAQHRNRFSPSDIKPGELRSLLNRAGWETRPGRGSHTVLTKPGFANITLPTRLKPNTWRTIERVLGVQIESMISKGGRGKPVSLDEYRRRLELAGQLHAIGFPDAFIGKHAGTKQLYARGFTSDMVATRGIQSIMDEYIIPHLAATYKPETVVDPRKPGPVSIRVVPRAKAPPEPTPRAPNADTRLHWHYIGNPKTLCGLPITQRGLRTQASKVSEMRSALASTADTCAECAIEFNKWDAAHEEQLAEAPLIDREPLYEPPLARSDDAVLELMGEIQSAVNALPNLIKDAHEAGTLRARLALAQRRLAALRGSLHAMVTEIDAVLSVLADSEAAEGDTPSA